MSVANTGSTPRAIITEPAPKRSRHSLTVTDVAFDVRREVVYLGTCCEPGSGQLRRVDLRASSPALASDDQGFSVDVGGGTSTIARTDTFGTLAVRSSPESQQEVRAQAGASDVAVDGTAGARVIALIQSTRLRALIPTVSPHEPGILVLQLSAGRWTEMRYALAANTTYCGVVALTNGSIGLLAGQVDSASPIGCAGDRLDCDCSADSALPLLAAAVVNGEYVALASTSAGPRLFSLIVDDARAVSLGVALSFQVPAEFEASSLGVARNRLVLSGGLPFVWRSYQVDDQAEPIHVFGVGPAAFFLDPGVVEPIALPDMSAQVFATVGDVAETSSGNVVVMIEHSGGESESRYAGAVDVFEEAPGGWSIRASARDLGESGPNHLVVDGDAVSVELNTSRGTQLVGSAAPVSPSARSALSPDILGDDEVVSLVPVAGAKGQSVVIGKRSARLIYEVEHVL